MPKKWVVNASPLIILGKIGLLELLPSLAEELVIPEGVKAEIEAGPLEDPSRRWLIGGGKHFVRNVGPIEPIILYWDLGRGETEVLSWAHKNPGFEAILDDHAARRCALTLGIKTRGTLAVLILAKKRGLISEVSPLLGQIVEMGFRITPEILKMAKQLAGE